MNAILEQINSMGKGFAEFALPMLIQSSVLIAILLTADFLLRKKVRAVFRYWIWMLVLVKLMLPSSLSSPMSIGYWFGDELTNVKPVKSLTVEQNQVRRTVELPARPRLSEKLDAAGNEVKSSEWTRSFAEVELNIAPAVTEAANPPVVSVTPVTWQGGVFLAWLAVVAAMGLLLIQRAIFVSGLVAQAKKANGLMDDALDFCRIKTGVNGKIGLKVSANATSPAVCGLFRPVILVPQDLGPNLGASGLRAVLMHELAHIKRGDLWVNLAQTILQIIYFYNPLLWLANCIIRRVREQAVDETVQVAMGEKAESYPQTLVDVAKLAFKRPTLSLRLIGVVESKSLLKGRVERMLNRPIPKSAKLGLAGLLAIVITGAVLLPMAKAEDRKKTGGAQKDSSQTYIVTLKPVVVKTIPAAFADDVSPRLRRITVKFDQPMMDESYSWTGGGETFPKITGDIRYDRSKTTCALPVKLEPGKVYWVGINSPSYKNFQTSNHVPAKRYVILFATKDKNGNPTPIPQDLLTKAKEINASAEKGSTKADRMAAEDLAGQGWQLWRQRKLAEAERLFKKAVLKDPANANAWNGLGWSQSNQGKPLNAKVSFEKCLEIEPKHPAALNGLGWIAKAQGKIDEAIGHWKKAVSAAPTATAALNGLTTTYVELEQYDKAIKYYRMWLKVEPDNADVKTGLEKAKAINERAGQSKSESIPYTQIMFNDIQPDGTILFKSTIRQISQDVNPIRSTSFINSDFVHIESMSDGEGKPIKFTSTHERDIYRYKVTFNEPVMPGEMMEYSHEGKITELVKSVQGKEKQFWYFMRHWPAAGRPTRRVETYLLPEGAELISVTPEDMQRRTKDGRIELAQEKIIPPGGSITTAFQYRLTGGEVAQARPFRLNPAPWADGEIMRMKLNTMVGMEMGEIIYTAESVSSAGKDAWRIQSYMVVPINNTQQFTSVDAQRDSFAPITGRTKNQLGDFTAKYEQDRVELTVSAGGKEMSKEIDLENIAYDNEQVLYLIRRLSLEEGYHIKFPILPVQGGTVVDCVINITGKEQVTVPAGTFDCYKTTLAVYSGTIKTLEHRLWLSADQHQYLVKYDSGQAIMELVETTVKQKGRPRDIGDEELGLSITIPADWHCSKSSSPAPYKLSWQLLAPALKSWSVLTAIERAPLTAVMGDIGARQIAEMDVEVLKGYFKNYTVRQDSWSELEINKTPAVSYVADYDDKDAQMVEYRTYLLGESVVYWFVFRIEKDKFEANKDEFDTIVNSFKLNREDKSESFISKPSPVEGESVGKKEHKPGEDRSNHHKR